MFGFVWVSGLIGAAVSTVAGGSTGTNVGFADGAALTQALFNFPHHTIVDLAGNVMVADCFNQRVRRIAPNGGTRLFSWLGICNIVSLCVPSRATCVRAVVTTLAGNGFLMTTNRVTPPVAWADGSGNTAQLSLPTYLALDGRGNVVVGDSSNHRIRLLSAAGGIPCI